MHHRLHLDIIEAYDLKDLWNLKVSYSLFTCLFVDNFFFWKTNIGFFKSNHPKMQQVTFLKSNIMILIWNSTNTKKSLANIATLGINKSINKNGKQVNKLIIPVVILCAQIRENVIFPRVWLLLLSVVSELFCEWN